MTEGRIDLISLLARHIVCVTYFDRSPQRIAECGGRGRFTVLSGFLISVRNVWYFMTAGHIISDIDEAIQRGQRLEHWELDDTYGWKAEHMDAVPFDYASLPRFHVYQDGYDYGVVQLRPYYYALLSANKTAPVAEESWEKKWPETFDGYAMLGFPSQLIHAKSIQPDRVEVNGAIALLGLTKIGNPPGWMLKDADRFYGKVSLPTCSINGEQLTDIDGMSGGPIFAFRRNEDGRQQYWLYAVQSGWDRRTRTIAACPIQEFIKAMAAHIDGPKSE
jgi:hypothetical protein